MVNSNQPEIDFEQFVRLVQAAKGLEAGGFYNSAKLFRALAFSVEVRAGMAHALPAGPVELDHLIASAIQALPVGRLTPDLHTALEAGRQAARANRTISATEVPAVFVCRSCGEIVFRQAPEICPACKARALTFREFLPVYWLEPLHPQLALAALQAMPGEVEQTIDGLDEVQLSQPPQPGEWAIRDVLWHLLVAQELFGGRVEKMLNEDEPELKGLAAWTIEPEQPFTAREIFERFRAARLATIARLAGISFEDWWRAGLHEEFGRVTILQQASYFVKHDQTHLPQLEDIRLSIG